MSFRNVLEGHMKALPVSQIKKILSKYNKELDIRGYSKMKKDAIISAIKSKKPMDKTLLAKLTKEAETARKSLGQKIGEKKEPVKKEEKKAPEKKEEKKKKIKMIPKEEAEATRKKAGDFLKDMEKKGKGVRKAVKATKDVKPKSKESKPKSKKSEAWRDVDTDRWDVEAHNLFVENKGKLPREHNGKVLYWHDEYDTDRSMTLSKRKTKNYNIPTYVREADGYDVGKNKWRDYSWTR